MKKDQAHSVSSQHSCVWQVRSLVPFVGLWVQAEADGAEEGAAAHQGAGGEQAAGSTLIDKTPVSRDTVFLLPCDLNSCFFSNKHLRQGNSCPKYHLQSGKDSLSADEVRGGLQS